MVSVLGTWCTDCFPRRSPIACSIRSYYRRSNYIYYAVQFHRRLRKEIRGIWGWNYGHITHTQTHVVNFRKWTGDQTRVLVRLYLNCQVCYCNKRKWRWFQLGLIAQATGNQLHCQNLRYWSLKAPQDFSATTYFFFFFFFLAISKRASKELLSCCKV